MIRTIAVVGAILLLNTAACQSAQPGAKPAGTSAAAVAALTPVPSAADVPMAPKDLQIPGTFMYSLDGNLWSFTFQGSPQKLTAFPANSFPAFPAVSPDGSQVAFSVFMPTASANDPGGTDLYLMNPDGSNTRALLVHDAPGSTMEAPAWSPDGTTILYTYRAQTYKDQRFVGEVVRLERTSPGKAQREPVLDGASHGSYFPDGKQIVYLHTDLKSYAQSLWIANADGSAPRVLVKDGQFSAIFAPRPSPDGKTIVFGGSGEVSGGAQGGARGHGPTWLPEWVRTLVSPTTAEAHGIPWDLYAVDSDGKNLRRLTTVLEDTPYAVWLPDGQHIAFLGERALYLVDKDGRQVLRLADQYGGLGLTWLPK